MAEKSNKQLLEELGVETRQKKKATHTAREERIIAGFEEIQRFAYEYNRPPEHGEDKDIFERLYALRLDRIRSQEECKNLVSSIDYQGLLAISDHVAEPPAEYRTDKELLEELGVKTPKVGDITFLQHVRPRSEVRLVEEVANRIPCENFEQFEPIFKSVQQELDSGIRETQPFKDFAKISEGDFFILHGQKVYVADDGETFINKNDKKDSRLRVIYDNGTESDILLRSLQRALNKDDTGRRITGSAPLPLFEQTTNDGDIETGIIYVLRSKSDHPQIAENRDVIHKIGVTGGKVKARIANAKNDPTFLMADVEIVATYELFNINRKKLEKLIHRFFEPAKLNIEIKDRFGNPIFPQEWFLVPIQVIDEAVDKIKDGTIVKYIYDIKNASLRNKVTK